MGGYDIFDISLSFGTSSKNFNPLWGDGLRFTNNRERFGGTNINDFSFHLLYSPNSDEEYSFDIHHLKRNSTSSSSYVSNLKNKGFISQGPQGINETTLGTSFNVSTSQKVNRHFKIEALYSLFLPGSYFDGSPGLKSTDHFARCDFTYHF